jgi:hypothetical protein
MTRTTREIIFYILVILSIIIVTATLYEDGSFTSLWGLIEGCLPWGLCQL